MAKMRASAARPFRRHISTASSTLPSNNARQIRPSVSVKHSSQDAILGAQSFEKESNHCFHETFNFPE
jgi:hypothetical protein